MSFEDDEIDSLFPLLGDLEVISNGPIANGNCNGQRARFESQSSEECVKDVLELWSKASIPKTALRKTTSVPKGQWLGALKKAKSKEDPWESFNIIEICRTERAKRFRYSALKKKWVQDIVLVKMQEESFGKGAMRKCYRMKKLSSMLQTEDWAKAQNIVAKRYIEDVIPKVYFDDVKLQMDAKLWAEEYSRYNPPKKIDIIQVAVIEMIDRKDHPLYHIEHFVEGKYVKYNSNSGFVLHEDENIRATPQAFSHFTFERSGHQMIVVDVQGVGDLYTDPQIHTASEDEYGEANLGAKGMALFFATHQCTIICKDLQLEPFDLSELEITRINSTSSRSSTSTEVKTPHSPQKMEPLFDLVERLHSVTSTSSLDSSLDLSRNGSFNRLTSVDSNGHISLEDDVLDDTLYADIDGKPCRVRLDSGVVSDSDSITREQFFNQHQKLSTCCIDSKKLTEEVINNRLNALKHYQEQQVSILGNIHYALSLYNYIGRFTDGEVDLKSALFHLQKAALCGSLEANKILAYKYFHLPTDDFEDLVVDENHDQGMDCLIEVATRGDRDSMMKVARAFDTGVNLGSARNQSWTEALKWYEATLSQNDADHGGFDPFPAYEINGRMAEIWRQGGHGVEKDPSYAGELYTAAADAAMNAGKGKLANRYFMLAEEAWGEVEE